MSYIVIKIGGSTLTNLHDSTIEDIAQLREQGYKPIIIHGGGPFINEALEQRGVPPEFKDGLRVTTSEVLSVTSQTLIGTVNPTLVSKMNQSDIQSIGINGVDAKLFDVMPLDSKYGYVGEPTDVDTSVIDAFMIASMGKLPQPWTMADAISLMAEGAGSLGMVGGQVLDIMSQERELSEQEVLDIQSRKTGRLINIACCLGAMAGGASRNQFEAASQFASGLGLAFQIRDDMLDVIGTREEMGKGVGTDAEKNTFVRLYGLEKCETLVQQYTDYAISALEAFDDREFMIALAKSLTERRV